MPKWIRQTLATCLILGGIGAYIAHGFGLWGWPAVDDQWQETDLAYRYLDPVQQSVYRKLEALRQRENTCIWLTGEEEEVLEEVAGVYFLNRPLATVQENWRAGDIWVGTIVAIEEQETSTEIERALEVFRQSLPDGLTPTQQVTYAYEYICQNVAYKESEQDQTLYSALVTGESVCAGYARMFQFLVQDMGIPCGVVKGEGETQDGEIGPHVWNIVELEGEFYQVDVTWGDDKWGPDYSYLCATTQDMAYRHTPDPVPQYPQCVATQENYYVANDLVLQGLDGAELNRILENQIGPDNQLIFRCATTQVAQEVTRALEQGQFGWYHSSLKGYSYFLPKYNENLMTYCLLLIE